MSVPRDRTVWTPELDAELTRLYVNERRSASVTATRMGLPSRNMVIGRATRLGLDRTFVWTAERVQVLRECAADGRSAGDAGKLLGCSRLAANSKAHRLGFHFRSNAGRPDRQSLRTAQKPPKPAGNTVSAPLPRQGPEEPGSATVLTLGAHMCKWPIGDPSSDEFTFCGRRISSGSFCTEHCRIAYVPRPAKGRGSASELARSCRRFL